MIRSLLFFFAVIAAFGQVVPGRYIVEFSDEPAASASRQFRTQDTAVASRLAAIRSGQALAEQQITAMSGRVRRRVENVANALVVEIPDSQAPRLRGLAGVKAVHQDEYVKLLLDHAVAVHRVTDVWNSLPNGRDSAGLGIKVGIIDSGISIEHPGFQDDSLPAVDGYPKVDFAGDKAYTNAKVIVARNYSNESTAQDRNGHGTAVAMAAAGATHKTPVAEIAGIAPKAYLGIYKVSGADGSSTFSAFLAAMDDALADGMDVVNYSSGATVTSSTSLQSVIISAVERAVAAGMLVTISAGNSGPGPSTVATPAIAPSAIAVAASGNERVFGSGVTFGDAVPYVSIAGNGPAPASPVSGPVVDLVAIGTDGMACSNLPKDQVNGKIALTLRGSCSFATKITNATAAGAIAVIVYNNLANSDLIRMDVGGTTLPAAFISAEDGADARSKLTEAPDLTATVNFDPFNPLPVTSNRMAGFSSAGPTAVATLKPDITAVGTSFYTAAQTVNSNGELYDPSGWIVTQGTSFSSPLVAGAIALLKSAKPGLTAAQYRSLIINSGRPLPLNDVSASPTLAGTGLLDLSRAVSSTLTAFPTSVDFGAARGAVEGAVEVTVTNTGTAADTFAINVDNTAGSISPSASPSTFTLDPGATQKVTVTLSGKDLEAGAYTGFLRFSGTTGAAETRVPYWFGAAGSSASSVSVLQTGSGSARQNVTRAIVFRIVDAAGLGLDMQPSVAADDSGARVNSVYTIGDIPGTYAVDVRMGTSNATFTITVGNVKQTAIVGLN